MTPLKTGLAVAWYSFWTGAPIKLAIILLFMAMHVHPWEMPGLAFFLLLSIPIDIWSIGVVTRTLFLEKFRVNPPDGLAMTLWSQVTAVNVVCLPVIYYLGGAVKDVAKSVAQSIMETELMKHVPVAERIGIELTLWGSVATVVLLVLIMVWLTIIGRVVLRQVSKSTPAAESYQGLIRRWDLMRVPSDQTLMLSATTLAGVLLTCVFWMFIPVSTPHPHQDYKMPETKVVPTVRPLESINKGEKALNQVDSQITALEARQAEIEAQKAKAAKPAPAKPAAAAAPAKAAKP
ncbi:MAG: hypothetical protein U0172_07310 [Nitrospiraceae bacterium]